MKRVLTGLALLVLLTAALPCFGVERFPPPDFEPGYQMPITTMPAPRAELLEFLDVAMLVLALALSTWFVLKKRSRKMIVGLGIASLLYFGFYRQGCVCAIGSIQNVALAIGDGSYAVPLVVVAFFLIPILFTLFFGRSFCAAVCPHGAMQDLVLLKPISLPAWLEKPLRLIPFVYVGLAVLFAATGSAFIICEWDPFIALFRRSGSTTMLALAAGFLLLGIFVGRPYCRFLCPYGALLSVFSRFSKFYVKLSPTDCNQCAICDVACPYGAIAEPVASSSEAATSSPSLPKRSVEERRSLERNFSLPKLALNGLIALTLITGTAWLGGRLAAPLSKVHRTVSLAEQIAGENAGTLKETTEASKAFRGTGGSFDELQKRALAKRQEFAVGGRILGGFIGLVFAAQWIGLSWPQRRSIYEPDRGNCVGCGRCYTYCPKEIVRVKRLAKPAVAPVSKTEQKS